MYTRAMRGRSPLPILTPVCAALLAVSIGVFCFPAGAGGDRDVLVKVEAPSPEAWELLRSLGARVHFRGEGYALVRLAAGALEALDDSGLSWTALPLDPDESLFYVMPEKGTGPVQSLDARILHADEEGAIVSAGGGPAHEARRVGFKVIPLDKAWPVLDSGFLDLDFIHDDVTRDEEFRRIVFRVSPDSLAANIKHLEDYGTRYTDTQQTLSAGNWLLKRLWSYGYPDTLLQTVSIDGKISIAPGNVMATKPGLTRPEFRVLVGGHYDSIVSGGAGAAAERAPGADDNASGTAATLEIARLLSDVELDATVQFVLFTAEELGMLGSLEFVTGLAAEAVPTDKLFFINMDMIGNSDTLPWKTRVYSDPTSDPLVELMAGIGKAYSRTEPVLSGGMGMSDQVSFWQLGYPAVFVHENDFSPVYHSVDDLLIHLEMDYEAEVVKMVLATVLHLATLAEPPEDVTASRAGNGEVRVEWSHSLDADLIGYHVEVVDRAGQVRSSLFTKDNFAMLQRGLLTDTTWVRIRAEDVLGEGDPSESVFVGAGPALLAEALPSLTTGTSRLDVFVPGPGFPAEASIRVHDVAGRLVNTLHAGRLSRGPSSFQWDGTLTNGDRAPAGVYFFAVDVAGVGSRSAKVIVAR